LAQAINQMSATAAVARPAIVSTRPTR
jgi:hypothetical protein